MFESRSGGRLANSSFAAARAGLPPPLLSSRCRGWNDVRVDLHHFAGVDAVLPVDDHLVGVHVAGSVQLTQSRAGRMIARQVGPGDIVITPCGEPKHFRHSGENVVILIGLAHAYLSKVGRELYPLDRGRWQIVENCGVRDDVMVALAKRMLAALEPEPRIGRMLIDSLKREVAVHLLRHYSVAAPRPTKAAASLSPRKLARAIDYIDSHLREPISIASLANALAISSSHLSHAFREATGMPPHRFLQQRRIECAKALLVETDLSITDIAHRIGCASHSHFSVMFHRATGRTPRDFRR